MTKLKNTLLRVVLATGLLLGAKPVLAQNPNCEGDLNGDGRVAVSELVRAVRSALEGCPPTDCPGDHNNDGKVTIAELVRAVTRNLAGCPDNPTPTSLPDTSATASPTQTATATATLSSTPTPTSATRFVNNGDGTIRDTTTGLVWESKSRDGSIHDQGNSYRWSAEFGSRTGDGSVFTDFLATLNAQSFGGHNDWRLPERAELEELRELGRSAITLIVPVEFATGCSAGCDVLSCSCTAQQDYWTATDAPDQFAGETIIPRAWLINFRPVEPAPDFAVALPKNAQAATRAVRGP